MGKGMARLIADRPLFIAHCPLPIAHY